MDQEPDATGGRGEPLTVQAAAQLQAAVVGLRAELAASEERSEADAAAKVAAEKTERRRWQKRMLAFFVFDVALTIALATVLSGQASTNRKIQDTNRQIQESLRQNYITQQQQAATRIKVLCPLYTVLLASASDPTRATVMTPSQRAQVASAIKVIKDGYTALGCLPALS